MENIFYVYLHRKKTDGTVFYVGKGHGNRAGAQTQRNFHWKNVVKKHGFTVEYAQQDMTEDAAFTLEIELIAKYGRADKKLGTLVNWTDGGEGASGVVVSAETRRKQSIAGKKRKIPLEQSLAALEIARLRAHTPEATEKRAAQHRGMKRSQSTCENISRAKKEAFAKRKEQGLSTHNARPVICIETGERYLSGEHANEALNITTVHDAANGAQLTAGGFHWVYEDESTPEKVNEILNRKPKPTGGQKKVVCVETGRIFNSVKAAGEWAQVKAHNISAMLLGLQKTAGGYRWAYA